MPRLLRCATALAGHHHPGAAAVLALAPSGQLDVESEGERAMKPVLEQLDPPPLRQQRIGGYRVDALLPDVPLVIDYLGEAKHAGAVRREEDARRDRDLRRRGYLVRYVTKADLEEPEVLLASLRAAREALRHAGARHP